jgi:hypothetical protein
MTGAVATIPRGFAAHCCVTRAAAGVGIGRIRRTLDAFVEKAE